MALSAKSQRELASQLEVLIFKKDSIYSQVDSLYNMGLEITVDSGDLDLFKSRMEKLEGQYSSFNKCIFEIVKLSSMLDGEIKPDVSTAMKTSSTEMDTRYYHLITLYKRIFPNETHHTSRSEEPTTRHVSEMTLKLPPIELPHFDGSLKDWPAFKDCFSSLIHENQSLSDVHKFQYLLSATKGDANMLVRTLPFTDSNYKIIWDKLLARFDNKRVLASYYIDEILNFENLYQESSTKLRLLLDTLSDNMSAIERIDFPDTLSNFIIFHIIIKKLDKRTRQLFEEEHSKNDFPKLDDLKSFLSNHCKAIEAVHNNDTRVISKPQVKTSQKFSPRPQHSTPYSPQVRLGPNITSKSFVSNTASSHSVCIYCSETHVLHKCPVFFNLTPLQRRDFVRSKQVCFNCLGYFHMLNQCTSKSTCRKCNLRHHTLLHSDLKPYSNPDNNSSISQGKVVSNAPSAASKVAMSDDKVVVPHDTSHLSIPVNAHHASKPIETEGHSVTLLGTIKIKIEDSIGGFQVIRALADPGSQLSFITESCVKNLGLARHKYSLPIMGLSQTPVNNTKGIVNCVLKPRFDGQNSVHAKAVILDKITSPLPTCPISLSVKQSFQHLNLADDEFDRPGPIQFLIGADLYPQVFDGGRINSLPGYPTPFHSIFGWVLIGETSFGLSSLKTDHNDVQGLNCHLCISDPNTLDSQLKQFWEVEEVPTKPNFVSEDDKICESHFMNTYSRDPTTGRFIVKLPFREEEPLLGNSYNHALNRLCSLERRLESNEELKTSYHDFMDNYKDLGHMRPLNPSDLGPKYFIPHHGIFKDSTSTKFRTVFDASAPSSNGKSLNNLLHAGPKLQRDISDIICNFRLHEIVFVADIAKMYRQILVHPDHQPYQVILWRNSPSLPVEQYYLKTVTYGVSSSPFLAMRTLHQLVHEEGERFPLAVGPIMESMFVDDLLYGSSSLETALKIKDDITGLLLSGGFELKKWCSNCPEFLSTIAEEDREMKSSFATDDNSSVKVLGIKWCPLKDIFTYEVKPVAVIPTKRNILSHISKIFDILGWIAPVVIFAKMIIQRLWVLGIDWDELPSIKLQEDWLRFTDELPLLSEIEIPRYVLSSDLKEVSIHGFCDASTCAYAAVIYIHTINNKGISSVQIFIAKSRVAPLKTITLPKLELSGAVLLAKLLDYSKNILSAQLGFSPQVFAWSDSTIVLNWIHTSPHQLKTFTANRVSTIQDKTNPSDWYHVPTESNPADCASRGLYPRQLIDHSLWWKAPEWISQPKENWPSQDYVQVPMTKLPEVKQNALLSNVANIEAAITSNLSILERFSELERLKRVTAWCLRFTKNCTVSPTQRLYTDLTVTELKSSLNRWIKATQQHYFSDSLVRLKSNLPLSGALLRLSAFLDEQGLLRVGGRLHYTDLTYEKKHPILLPQQGHLSRLIVDFYHQTYFHVGPRTLQGLLLRRFWILSSRKVIRKRILQCVKCTKLKASSSPQPLMAPLPAFRLQRNRAFLQVGADFAGPFSTKSHRGRKPLLFKSYLCLFICMSTKAIHLEAVSSLSTEDFLAAFNRFIARRGLCSDIYTDNGTNFVGANNYLKDIFQFLRHNTDYLQRSLAAKEVKWHFNPASAPHFGGLWEAGVKSAKFHLRRIIGEQVFTFEELSTLFCQVEAVLNSRPLCSLSTDPSEAEVLTPGHFLIGDSLLTPPQEDLTGVRLNKLSRWQLIQQATQHFWRRWSNEYLHTLQQRVKWTKPTPNLALGDVVLIKEPNLPPLRWPIGRIIELHPGSDGIVRVVSLRTKMGQTITRPVVKLCPLPTQD